MTALDERLVIGSASGRPEVHSAAAVSRFAAWGLAARLARREVRRRPGRTLLVMLLAAVPVFAMSSASIVARTTAETGGEAFARQFGSADLVVFGRDRPRADTDAGGAFDAVDLPVETRTLAYVSTSTPVRAMIDGRLRVSNVDLTDVDLTDPLAAGTVDVVSGRVPAGAGEVLLAPKVADEFDVAVGDRLVLDRPDLDLVVVGLGEDRRWLENSLMVIGGFDRTLLREDRDSTTILIDLPPAITGAERIGLIDDLAMAGFPAESPDNRWFDAGPSGRDLAWGWVAGVLGFVAVGIVIAAAFATSARRQLVTIGLLAANGAEPRILRRTMGLQGAWTGVLGAIVGVLAAIAAGVGAHRVGFFADLAGRPVGALELAPIDLIIVAVTAVVAATMAASVPARSAARIPVLSALSGRQPVGQPPRWLAPTGVAVFLGGLLLLAAASAEDGGGDLAATIAVLGGLGVLFGMVCASPLIISGVAAVGSRRGGSTRLASRSLGRARSRSAAVVTAIAVVGSVATIASVAVSNAEQSEVRNGIGSESRTVTVFYSPDYFRAVEVPIDGTIDREPSIAPPLPDDVRTLIEAAVPGAEWTPITRTVNDPEPFEFETGQVVSDQGLGPELQRVDSAVVVDDGVLRLAEFTEAELFELDATGVLVVSPWLGDRIALETLDEPIELDVSGSTALFGLDENPDESDLENYFDENPERHQLGEVFVSDAFVVENDLSTTIGTYNLEAEQPLTQEQASDLAQVQSLFGDDAFIESATAPGSQALSFGSDDGWAVGTPYQPEFLPWSLIRLAVLMVSLMMVLAVVAIGLSLAATESRDERDVLRAVGASPSTLRQVAATKAWVLATGAAVVAVPVGYTTVFVITRAMDDPYMSARFPFAVAAALLIAIPLATWVATLAVSTAAQRLRPSGGVRSD